MDNNSQSQEPCFSGKPNTLRGLLRRRLNELRQRGSPSTFSVIESDKQFRRQVLTDALKEFVKVKIAGINIDGRNGSRIAVDVASNKSAESSKSSKSTGSFQKLSDGNAEYPDVFIWIPEEDEGPEGGPENRIEAESGKESLGIQSKSDHSNREERMNVPLIAQMQTEETRATSKDNNQGDTVEPASTAASFQEQDWTVNQDLDNEAGSREVLSDAGEKVALQCEICYTEKENVHQGTLWKSCVSRFASDGKDYQHQNICHDCPAQFIMNQLHTRTWLDIRCIFCGVNLPAGQVQRYGGEKDKAKVEA